MFSQMDSFITLSYKWGTQKSMAPGQIIVRYKQENLLFGTLMLVNQII